MNPVNLIVGVIATALVFIVGSYTNNQSLGQAAAKPSVVRIIAIETFSVSEGTKINNHRSITKRILSPEGKVIGNGYQLCVVVRKGVEQCSGIFNLPTGKITYSGSRQNRSRYTFVVTGGTGSYLAAGGRLNSVAFGLFPFRERITIHIE